MPEPPETTCIPDKTRERFFLSENMASVIPYQQLLSNPNLAFRDMAAIGIKVKKQDRFEIRPIFSGKKNFFIYRFFLLHEITLGS